MGAIGKLFSGPKADPNLAAERAESRRLAEEEQRKQQEKDQRLRNARMRGRVGYASLLGAGTGENQTKKNLLG